MSANERGKFRVRGLRLAAWAVAAVASAQSPAGNEGGNEAVIIRERAEYAAEHERDRAKAEAIFEERLRLLEETVTKDHPRYRALKAEYDAFLARRRTGAAPQDDVKEATLRRVRMEIAGLNQKGSSGFANLLVLGAAAVPELERVLEGKSVVVDGQAYVVPTGLVCRVLAAMTDPAGDAALGRALRSANPLVRTDAAQALDPARHRELLGEALKDSARAVRDAAISAALAKGVVEEAWAPEVLKSARDGNRSAVEWACQNRRDEAFAVLLDPAVGGEIRGEFREALSETAGLKAAEVARLLDAADKSASDAVQDSVRSVLLGAADRGEISPLPEALRLRIEAWWIDRVERQKLPRSSGQGMGRSESLWIEVATWRSAAALDTVVNTKFAPNTGNAFGNNLAVNVANRVSSRLKIEDFDALVGLLPRLSDEAFADASTGRGSYRCFATEWVSAFARRASPAVTTNALAKLEGIRRRWYLETVIAKSTWGTDNLFSTEGYGAAAKEMLGTESPTMVDAALRYLARYPQTDALASIVRVYRTSPNGPLSSKAFDCLRALAGRAPKEVAAAVEAAVSEPFEDPSRADPASLIGALAAGDALRLFETLWSRPRTPARTSLLLMSLINRIEGPAATARVAALYDQIPPEAGYVRRAAVSRFQQTLYEPALPLLRDALTSGDDDLRAEARKAFAAFKENREALDELDRWIHRDTPSNPIAAALLEQLKDPEIAVVMGAAQALGALKAKEALPHLVALLSRRDDRLAAVVNAAIAQIGG